MKKRLLIFMIVVGVFAFSIGAYSYSWFTSRATSKTNTFTAGTLKVSVDGKEDSAIVQNISLADMQPGDITEPITIEVKNTGSLPAAIFGRFVMEPADGDDSGNHLFKDFSFYDYKVQYFKEGDTAIRRWTTHDSYHGTVQNEDYFIKEGNAESFRDEGGTDDLYDWITGKGPLDFMTTGDSWDMEGIGPKGYYVVTFRIKYDESATVQGQNASLGYEVHATQINQKALDEFEESTLHVPSGSLAGQEDDLTTSANLYK